MEHARPVVRLALTAALLCSVTAGAWLWGRSLLPAEGKVATGLVVAGGAVQPGECIDSVVRRRVAQWQDRRARFELDGAPVLEATLAELGLQLDEQRLRAAVAAVGREGSIWRRLDDALEARRGRLAISLVARLPLEPLAGRLAALKEQVDTRAKPARWDFEGGMARPHENGRAIDVPATLAALEQAREREGPLAAVALQLGELSPLVTAALLDRVDRSTLLARVETRFAFLGGQAGRAQNIARAAAGVDGMVLWPGELVSFNAAVGPRSADNGFAQAGEIYKGELILGVGGGTCQVASTFYSAAYLAGLDVVERAPHSRPSGYVPLGMDATVAYPDVDLKLRNPFSFPIIARAVLAPGSLGVELWGQSKPVTVATGTVPLRVSPYKRVIREADWLRDGRIVCKQKGIRGLVVRKVRKLHFADGRERVEESHDTYPATDEVLLVAPDADLGALPPLPDGEAAPEQRAAEPGERG